MQIMTVSAFLAYVNETFKAIWDTQEVAIEGEVSGYRLSQGQWVSFDLKDGDALVNIFLPVWKLVIPLVDGARVRVFGMPRVYPKYGKFSFSAERIELTGEGGLRKALELLRQKLAAEGLFDPGRKRVLPRFPSRIALVASRESAAYGDFIRVLKERWGGLEIDLYHVLVQGERAPEAIVRAIQATDDPEKKYDALVLTRGGGSLDELMAFNDERVVRALYASKIPTLVGIGHERDVTLAEEVADVRGSTPTDCARRLVPDRHEVEYELAMMQERMHEALRRIIERGYTLGQEAMTRAERWLTQIRFQFDQSSEQALSSGERWIESLGFRTRELERLLASFDPRAVLRRGYGVIRDEQGRIRTSLKGMKPGEGLIVDVGGDEAKTLIQSINYGKKEA